VGEREGEVGGVVVFGDEGLGGCVGLMEGGFKDRGAGGGGRVGRNGGRRTEG